MRGAGHQDVWELGPDVRQVLVKSPRLLVVKGAPLRVLAAPGGHPGDHHTLRPAVRHPRELLLWQRREVLAKRVREGRHAPLQGVEDLPRLLHPLPLRIRQLPLDVQDPPVALLHPSQQQAAGCEPAHAHAIRSQHEVPQSRPRVLGEPGCAAATPTTRGGGLPGLPEPSPGLRHLFPRRAPALSPGALLVVPVLRLRPQRGRR